MGARVSDTLTGDGRKFRKMLEELAALEVRVGFQHGEATEEDGTDVCDVAAWNELGAEHAYGNIPPRPFLRKSVDENKDKITDFVDAGMEGLVRGFSARQFLELFGLFQKDLIQEKITEGDFEPNKESTIRKKGSDKPLIDSGRMRQSVNYQIKRKGSD